MLKRVHYLFSVVLFAVLGLWMLPSCTDILGINTDHVDNPCNDPDKVPDPIECGKGACHVFLDYCDENGLPAECVPGPAQDAEDCKDGLDNDCDGSVDCDCEIEGAIKSCFSGSTSERPKGVCHDGTQVCINLHWGPCTGDVLPGKEVQDGFDNDCDGEIDEDFECQEGAQQYCYDGPPETLIEDDPSTPETEQAPCKRGTQTCTKEGKWDKCVGSIRPALEKCDGIDNDCNGTVDDVPSGQCECIPDGYCYSGPKGTDGVGECKGGKAKCQNGTLIECVGEIVPEIESCDGRDHDCNGVVDNYDADDPMPPCVCKYLSQRECYDGPDETKDVAPCKTGTQSCVKGKWGACEGQVTPATESCNNVDDDCNGLVDDGVPGVGAPCVIDDYLPNSPCYQGKKLCDPETMMPGCVPNVLPFVLEEVPCNNIDENCNGLVDDGQFCCFGDGVQNGNETDSDCGGACDTKCADGKKCKISGDCESKVCSDFFCFPPVCGDTVKNGDETDTDCGGPICPKCTEGKDCKINNDCVSNVCDPNTKKCAKKPIGDSCQLNNECQTSYCVDGFCCDSPCNGTCQACSATKKSGGSNGYCGNIPVGTDPDEECGAQDPSTCGTNGVCDGAGACQKHVAGTECLAASCANPTTVQKAKTCNGLGTCEDKGTLSCEPYTCAGGVCGNICSTDAQCASTAYCNAPVCLPKKPLGAPCGVAKECSSNSCVDGVCCDTACAGICQACIASKKGPGGGTDGTCGPIAVNTDPDFECNDQGAMTCGTNGVCDGASACQTYANGTQCTPAACADATTLNQASVCPGGGAACPMPVPKNCSPYICTTGPGGSACRIDCTVDSHCATGYYCNGQSCLPKKVIGVSCGLDHECNSNFCADNVCCNTACSGTCQSCLAAEKGAGLDGFCGNVAANTDPQNDCTAELVSTCGLTGQCDGAGACQKYAAGTVCTAASCSGTVANPQKQCDGAGNCTGPASQDCAPFLCVANACPNSCVNDSTCAAGKYCLMSTCVNKKADGAACSGANECNSNNCVDGVCCNTSCAGTCQACNISGSVGACTTVPNGTSDAGTCSSPNVCLGGICKKGNGENCSAASECASANCVDNVCCGSASCGTCQACNVPGSLGACASVPDGTSDPGTCNSPNTCIGGACKLAGGPCSSPADCQSGNCVDGVCCNTACTGTCQACNVAGSLGTCANVPNGTSDSGTCDNPNTCASGVCKKVNGQTCGGGADCQSGNCVDGVCCNTTCTGTCQSCNVAGSVGTCSNVANGTSDPGTCNSPSTCTAGVCKKINGQTCGAGGECQSGNCVDGVCCNSTCTGTCQACNVAGSAGTCSNVSDGTSDPGTCNSPSTCTAGVCKKPDGQSCGGGGDCQSGNCVDGVCCNSTCTGTCQACNVAGSVGTCSNVANGASDPGTCNSPSTCAAGVCKKINGQTCGAGGECQSGNCVDGVCCNSTCTGTCQACNQFGSFGTCSNVTGASDPGTCDSPDTCVAGACKKADGQACGAGGECQSGNCVDGVCCNTACAGTCQACNVAGSVGTCANVAAGMSDPGTCSSPNTCAGGVCQKPDGQACGGAGECQSGNCVDGVCCGTTCAGTCQACNVAGSVGTCANVAAGMSDPGTCNSPNTCAAGVCQQVNGQACSTAAQCQSGNCVDGVCCNTACAGTCQACDLSGSAGTCTNILSGDDPQDECVGPETVCDGAGACKKVAAASCSMDAECLSTFCSDNVCCDDACSGTCEACNLAGSVGMCAYILSGDDPDDECLGAAVCDGTGFCEAQANGGACTLTSECTSGFCADGVCCDTACSGVCAACSGAKTGGTDGTCASVPLGADPDDECLGAGVFCTGAGLCQAQANGGACTTAAECTSGNCVDGFCCNTACSGTCVACSAAKTGGANGTCANVSAGTDPDSECAGGKNCNGSGACTP